MSPEMEQQVIAALEEIATGTIGVGRNPKSCCTSEPIDPWQDYFNSPYSLHTCSP